MSPITLLRIPAVSARTGLSRSLIRLMVLQERFPQPISITERTVGWVESEVNDWIESRVKAGRAKN